MNAALLKLSLDRLESSDWAHFEKLCSAFLVSEFASLRTMAHPAGDGGRDSELFSPDGKSFIAIQYSIAKDWRKKIRATAKRLAEKFPHIRMLIYMSNQLIGGQADDVKKELLEKTLVLDTRDQNWFIERAITDEIRENASSLLIDAIASPYLASEELINRPSSPLTSNEAKAALTYLGLQWQDDISNKGLTKLSFDALVRAALRHTTSDKRITREKVHESVLRSLPSAEPTIIKPLIDSALIRLTKRFIRYWKQEDEFCLTHEEHLRILSRLAEIENQEIDFINLVNKQCEEYLFDIGPFSESDIKDLRSRIPRILEYLLLRQGESFATAVQSNNLDSIGYQDLSDIIFNDLHESPMKSNLLHHYPKLISSVIRSLLSSPAESTNIYLRRLSSSYTLLSFLNQTPDVQSAIKKIFSHGTIWLDTTVLLPLLAEQLGTDQNLRKLEKVFEMCRNAGAEFRVTSGIIQEINAHMNNALSCSQYSQGCWQGRVPYLYKKYLNQCCPR